MHTYLRRSLFILPNLLTLASISCGFYAIVICAGARDEDAFYRASLFILFAMFFDLTDGRVARLTRTQSAFGMQIDSLADLVSFGVAPALLVYRWSLEPLGALGFAAAFTYLAAGASRLARFNVLAARTSAHAERPGKYIVGLTIPSAAGVLISLVAGSHASGVPLQLSRGPITLVVIALALFMVSTIRFRSFKDLSFSPRTVAFVSALALFGLVLSLTVHVSFALGFMLVSYVVVGVFESSLGVLRRAFRRTLVRTLPEPLPHDDGAEVG